jgi:hypothetical protein
LAQVQLLLESEQVETALGGEQVIVATTEGSLYAFPRE